MTTQTRELLHPELASDWSFPVLPGNSHHYLQQPHQQGQSAAASKDSHSSGGKKVDNRNAVLELVKYLMQVLSLDKNIAMEARLLRKELLAIFDVREFGRDGAFRNPSASLKLGQWSCPECTLARDWDLCRDEALLPDLGSNAGGGGAAQQAAAGAGAATSEALKRAAQNRAWRCGYCEAELDRLAVEERLVADVQAAVVRWTTQDVKCGRCGAFRANEFAEHCVCSGAWTESLKRDDVRASLRVYAGVADWFGLRMLGALVGEVLEGL